MNARTRGDLLILLAAFIWGVAFYFQKVAMQDIGPLLFLGMRGAIAALVLLPFMLSEQRRAATRAATLAATAATTAATTVPASLPASLPVKQAASTARGSIVPYALLAGVVFFLAGATQQTGIVSATVTNTGFLTALYVVVTPFLFWVVRRQRPGALTWLSVGLAFAGVWALSGGALESLNQGDILVACSSLFWATLIIISGEASRHAQPLTYTCIQFAVVAVLAISSAFVFEVVDPDALQAALIPILYVGVLSSAFTFGIMAIALQHVPAPRASILLSMETVFAAMAGYLFLAERLTVLGWIGASLILLAVVVVQRSRD